MSKSSGACIQTGLCPYDSYDVVVCGVGTGSSTALYSLRAKNPNLKILAIERGPPVSGRQDVPNPAQTFAMEDDPEVFASFALTSNPQTFGRRIAHKSGKGWGGSSCVNYQVYERGTVENWNALASACQSDAGSSGWTWLNQVEFWKSIENYDGPTLANGSRGTFGPQHVHLATPTPLTDAFAASAAAVLEQAGIQLGNLSPSQQADSNERSYGSGVFLTQYSQEVAPGVFRRSCPGLDLLDDVGAWEGVIKRGTVLSLVTSKQRVTGVLYLDESVPDKPATRVAVLKPKGVVIMGMGAVETPRLLLSSNLTVPRSLGQNLKVHFGATLLLEAPSQLVGTDPISSNFFRMPGILRFADGASGAECYVFMMSGWATSDPSTLSTAASRLQMGAGGSKMTMQGWLINPQSSGQVSADGQVSFSMYGGVEGTQDLANVGTLVQRMLSIVAAMNSQLDAKMRVVHPILEDTENPSMSDAQATSFAVAYPYVTCHWYGTCALGDVVNASLCVKNTANVFVSDASVLINGGISAAPSIMCQTVGNRCAQSVLAALS